MYQVHDFRNRHRITRSVGKPITGKDDTTRELELALMLAGFRPEGGVLTGDQLATLLRDHSEQPVSTVARWVVQRSILNLVWLGQTFIPLFQFDRSNMQPHPQMAATIRELAGVYDDWEIGLWFARPNAWLDDDPPLRRLRSDPEGVYKAAQADRFIIRG